MTGPRRLNLARGGARPGNADHPDTSFMRQVAEARRRQAISALPERLRQLTDVAEKLTAAVNELRREIAQLQQEPG